MLTRKQVAVEPETPKLSGVAQLPGDLPCKVFQTNKSFVGLYLGRGVVVGCDFRIALRPRRAPAPEPP